MESIVTWHCSCAEGDLHVCGSPAAPQDLRYVNVYLLSGRLHIVHGTAVLWFVHVCGTAFWFRIYIYIYILQMYTLLLSNKTSNVRITYYWGAFAWPLLQWKSNKYYIFWVCVCSLSYAACKAHAPYYIVICGLSGCTVFFPHYLINGTIFGKRLLNIKCVFWFYLQLLSETFIILRRIQRDIIINVHRSSCKVPLLLSDFNETWIFLIDFRIVLKYQVLLNLSSGSRVVPCGRRDRQKYRKVAFRSFSKAPESRQA
jgi:hypothetical protein